MGALSSKPLPPDVDLLPPRFERRQKALSRVSLDPHEYLFGREKLDRLFTGLYARPESLAIHASLRPDFEEKSNVSLYSSARKQDVGGSAAAGAAVQQDDFGLALTYEETTRNPAWQTQVRFNSDGSLRAAVSSFDQVTGVGFYGILPGEYFLRRRYEGAQGGGTATATATASTPQVGYGIHGPPTRYVHASSAGKDVSGSMAEGSTGAAPGARGASLVPEVGYRFVSPAQTWSSGVHMGLVEPYPFKLWAVGRMNGGQGSTMTAGVSLASNDKAMGAALQAVQTPAAHAAGGGGSPAPIPTNPFIINAALSVAQEPTYEATLAYDGARAEAVASFVQCLTVRRRVYNPLGAAHIKGIYQYVDMGLEFRQGLAPPFAPSMAAAASWQLNRHLLLRGRIGSRDVAASVAARSWSDPSVALALTASYDRHKGKGGVGLFLSVEKGGDVEYSKAVAGQQKVVPNRALVAREELSRSVTATADNQPFLEPPTVRAALTGTGQAEANRFL